MLLKADSLARIADWADLWGAPKLPGFARISFSSSMRRSLGRCKPAQGTIRLNQQLADASEALLNEVLCHELAHAAVFLLHGKDCKPHGPEWKNLMRLAGYKPRVRIPADELGEYTPEYRGATRLYEHKCGVCGARRVARRVVRQWRCRTCIESGLPGKLDVYSIARA